jgi:hypothetical protein
LRIALISMGGEFAAELRLAGHSLAWHQLQAALALSCERIVCLAEAPGPQLADLQREAERRGATFHAVTHHRALSGLVRAADTLVVFAPGVLPDVDWLAQTFGARAGVAVLPAEGAVEQGFERIDRERAWAGVLATRGDAVEALGVLPPDADPIAGLLRVALQRGATAVAVPDKWLDQSRWALIATPAAAEQYQAGWYLRHVPAPAFDRPGAAVAHRLAQRIVARVNNAARAATGLIAGGAIGALGSAVAGYLGYTVAAMAGLAAASALLATGSALGRLARAGSREGSRAWPPHARRALLDLSLVAIAASPSVFEGWTAAFAALVLVATIRIAREPFAPFALRWLSDRTVVFVLLTVAAVAGGFIPALALLALFGLVLHLFWPRSKQLTPV